jgi:hypothetical protein
MRSRPGLVLGCALVLSAPSVVVGEVIERIVAAVDGRPLLASDLDVMARLRDFDTGAPLEALIDEELMFREAGRLPQATPTAEELERALASLKARAGALADSLPAAGLQRVARREATIVKYAGFRFAPQVRVEDEEVRLAYETEGGKREDAAHFGERAAALRARLMDQKLGERIEAWVKELRAAARIRYNVAE